VFGEALLDDDPASLPSMEALIAAVAVVFPSIGSMLARDNDKTSKDVGVRSKGHTLPIWLLVFALAVAPSCATVTTLNETRAPGTPQEVTTQKTRTTVFGTAKVAEAQPSATNTGEGWEMVTASPTNSVESDITGLVQLLDKLIEAALKNSELPAVPGGP
jgi:hypothetical protein